MGGGQGKPVRAEARTQGAVARGDARSSACVAHPHGVRVSPSERTGGRAWAFQTTSP